MYANRESWGVVARYLRSEGAALHSPTWLPTGRLRATFLNPQSFLSSVPDLQIVSQSVQVSPCTQFLSAHRKVFGLVAYLFFSFVGERLRGSPSK